MKSSTTRIYRKHVTMFDNICLILLYDFLYTIYSALKGLSCFI